MEEECRNPETCGYYRFIKPYKNKKGIVYCVKDIYARPGEIELKECTFAPMRKKRAPKI